jgi:hypothetical protein
MAGQQRKDCGMSADMRLLKAKADGTQSRSVPGQIAYLSGFKGTTVSYRETQWHPTKVPAIREVFWKRWEVDPRNCEKLYRRQASYLERWEAEQQEKGNPKTEVMVMWAVGNDQNQHIQGIWLPKLFNAAHQRSEVKERITLTREQFIQWLAFDLDLS